MNKIWMMVICCSLTATELAAQNSLTFADTRAVPTTPASYNRTFAVNFKRADSVQLLGTGGVYVALLGMRAWADNSGGKSHEIAFAQNSNVYVRSGLDPTWEKWRRLISEDVNGNVGIGTITPQAKLEVVGSINVNRAEQQTANPNIRLTTSDGKFMLFSSSMGTANYNNIVQPRDQAIIYGGNQQGTGTLVIAPWAGNTSGIRIDANGNVGIGTPYPVGYKLAVAGSVIAERVKVKPWTAWPDFVFRRDYQLPSLQEVEHYINENGHLPDMPTAAEVEQEGVDVGEMNRKLLQKVEELTLYIIDLKKEINQLKSSKK